MPGFAEGLILAAVIVVFLIIILVNCMRIVPQEQAYIVEFLGKYKTTWQAGFHLKMPVLERIVRKISLKEQVLDFPPQPVITKDNVSVNIDSVVFAKVFDPRLYTYGVENPIAGLQNLSATTLRNIIGSMELDQTLTSRDKINSQLEVILDQATDAWGIKVTRVELKNIMPPREIEEVMTKQMRAERERRQTVLEAQAHQEAVVSRAKGDKEAKVLAAQAEKEAKIAIAEGQARSIELVYQAQANGIRNLHAAGIDESILKYRSIDALKEVSNGRATKIYMPSDLTGIVSAVGVLGEALGVGDATPMDKSAPAPRPLPADPCIDEETSAEGKLAAETNAAIELSLEK